MTAKVDENMKKLVKALKANHFDPVELVEDAEAAKNKILELIPAGTKLGIAGSTTVSQIEGLREALNKRGIKGPDGSMLGDRSLEDLMRIRHDMILTSSNAVTMDGKLVNVDGTGNRVSSMIFGPKKVVLVIGRNKIVRDVPDAIDRIKKVIAPYHARALQHDTPCAKTGVCADCKSAERVCNVTTIIERKPTYTDIAIVLVNEDLGLGWNPDWQEERKEKIGSVYLTEVEKLIADFHPPES
jgi:hypothetical protein